MTDHLPRKGESMKTLEDFNKERMGEYMRQEEQMSQPRRNGISCPECGAEMFDSSPGITLTSCPPQKHVHCSCGFQGYRYD